MKKVKLLMILMCVLACLSGCTIDSDTFTGKSTKTTCKLTSNNVQTTIVLRHNGEEINDKEVDGKMVWLNYTLPNEASLEEQEKLLAEYNKKHPIESDYLIGPANLYADSPGADQYLARELKIGPFSWFRNSNENINYFKLSSELIKKDVMTYQDFTDHLVSIGYECK